LNADQPKSTLAGNALHETLLPSWSSNGLLCFYDKNAAAYLFLDPVSQDIITLPNQTGQAGNWHPDGGSFIAPEIMFLKTSEAIDDLEQIASSHLMLFNITDGSVQDLTPGEEIEDVNPVFSPDGQQLVFARKFLDVVRWTPGRQIWLLDLKDGIPQQLLQEPLYNHFDFSWNPNGEQIAYVRFNQSTLNEPPEIWLIDLRSGLNTRLVINGYAPRWVP
jgi:dipeptidyl aminopeptidase/acylaminoacyl peptidase